MNQRNFLESIRYQHGFTFQPELPRTILQAANWKFVAELMLRHPDSFTIETDAYPTGQPMLWAKHKSRDLKVGLVEGSSVTVFNPHHRAPCPVCDAIPDEENSRLHVLDVFYAEDPDWAFSDLEVCMGIQDEPVAGSFQTGSITAAVIRDILWHANKSSLELSIRCLENLPTEMLAEEILAFDDLSSKFGYNDLDSLFSRFEEEIRHALGNFVVIRPMNADVESEALAFDLTKGMVHSANGGGFPLMDEIIAGGTSMGIALGLSEWD